MRPASTVNGLSVVSGRSVVRSRSSRSGVGLNSVYWLLLGSEASAAPPATRARTAATRGVEAPRRVAADALSPAGGISSFAWPANHWYHNAISALALIANHSQLA